MAKSGNPRIAVLGAGPIGLEAALYARKLGLAVTIYERGRAGEHLHRWGHVRLFSPFGMNATPLGREAVRADHPEHVFPAEGDCLTGREHLAAYLEPLAQSSLLRECLHAQTQVVQVGRRGFLKEEALGESRRAQEPFRLLLRSANNHEETAEADAVLDCTGTYAQHRWLGDGGIPASGESTAEPNIAYGLEDILGERRSFYAGKNVLVIGAGYSAASSVCALATLAQSHPDTWTVWLAKGSGTQPLKRIAHDPLRERDRLAMQANTLATRPEGNVEFHNQMVVEAVECAGPDRGFKVAARWTGKDPRPTRTWEVDRLIANVGYSPDTQLYRELQVHECYATLGPMSLAASLLKSPHLDCTQMPAAEADTLRNPEPGFFILGAKSYGRNSNFLLRTGFEQIKEVFTLITGKKDCDLYKKR